MLVRISLLHRDSTSLKRRSIGVAGLLFVSVAATVAGTFVAFLIERTIVGPVTSIRVLVAVGLIEEALVRLAPLVFTFYVWSYYRRELLSKTEGLAATLVSGLTVSVLEVTFKLQSLALIERTARLDALLLPIVFVHLPLALIAGRFAYALGERIHGQRDVGIPHLSTRTLGYLVGGYLVLVAIHVSYNATV